MLSIKNKSSRRQSPNIKAITISIILLAGLMVVLATLTSFFFTPENTIKREVESLARDYYENIIYKNIADKNASNLPEVLGKYSESGFSRVTLRQLLLINAESHPDAAATITAYCNEDSSYVVIFPDAPYGQADYHIDYHYSCKF